MWGRVLPCGRVEVRRAFIAGWLALGVLALAIYVGANPPLEVVAHRLIPLLTALVVTLALVGLGAPLARRLMARPDPSLELATALCLGVGSTALLTFVKGFFVGTFDARVYGAWLLLGLGLAPLAAWRHRAHLAPSLPATAWGALGLGVLLALGAVLVPFVVAPEASVDALAYHLLIPKLFLEQGRIAHLPLFIESNYPNLAEYVYLPVLMLGDEVVCKCLHFWMAVAVLLSLASLSRALFPTSSPVLAPALFASMPVVAIHMGWAWNDFFFTLFVLTALAHLMAYDDLRQARPALAAGLMLGLAVWTKYTFILYVILFALLLCWGMARRRWRVGHVALFGFGVAAVAWLHLLEDYSFTGNPVYPFLNGLFQSPEWTDTTARYFHDALRLWEIRPWRASTYLTFAVPLFLRPRLIDTHPGVMPLLLVPLLFLPARNERLRVPRAFLLCGALAWLGLHSTTRTLLSLLAVLLCLGAGALQESFTGRGRQAAMAIVVVASVANLWVAMVIGYAYFAPIRYFLGLEPRAAYLSQVAGSQPAYDLLNASRDVGRVLVVSQHEPYYLAKPYLFSAFSDTPIAEHVVGDAVTVDGVARRLAAAGITHVMVRDATYREENDGGLYAWSGATRRAFETFLAERCRKLATVEGDSVYALAGGIGPPPP